MDVIASDAILSEGLPVIRSTVTSGSVGASLGSTIQGLDPVAMMFEHILASLVRFETRMDDFDCRLVPPRSDTAQSLGLSSHWFTDSLPCSVPLSIPT